MLIGVSCVMGMNHLLLHCPVAMELWNLLFCLFNVSWVMPRSIKELFLCWSLYKHRRRNLFWEAAPPGVCWIMWKERNRRVFDNVEGSISFLKNTFLRTLFFWCSESRKHSVNTTTPVNSFVEFVNSF